MSHRSRSWSGAVLALVMVVAVSVAATATAVAGEPDAHVGITFDIDYEACWVAGHADPGRRLEVRWSSTGGRVKTIERVTVDARGDWETTCDLVERVEPRDRIVVTGGPDRQVFRIRRLEASIDRVADRITGVSTPRTRLWIRAVHVTWGDGFRTVAGPATTDRRGRFRLDLAGRLDLLGGDVAWLTWSRARGDRITRHVNAPAMVVSRGDARLFVETAAFTPVTVELLGPAGRRRGVASDTTNVIGGFSSTFTDADGVPVTARRGDTVSALGLASDARWTVPSVWVRGDARADVIEGRCPARADYLVGSWAVEADGFSLEDGRAGPDGRFQRAFPLTRGHKLMVRCKLPTGDEVMRISVVE